MFVPNADSITTRWVCQIAGGGILLAGGAAALALLWLAQRRRGAGVPFPAAARLASLPFSGFHAAVTLGITLLFALASLHPMAENALPPDDRALVLGPLLYACSSVMVVMLCRAHTGCGLRQMFFSGPAGPAAAVAKGLLYGLAVIPPVALLSILVSAGLDAWGIAPQHQEVFNWLGDESRAPGTRLFMMGAAVFLAPLSEEALFRGLLFPFLLRGRTVIAAAWVSSLYFALVHLHLASFLPLMALGMAFSAGYAATGSLLTPITMHALFNLASLIFYLADPLP